MNWLFVFTSILAVIVGELANFVAYIFAPAVLVTPLGALSIIVRYALSLNSSAAVLGCNRTIFFIYF